MVLFGGTFDPVHHGHLIVARALAEARGLRRVTFLPSASPPHKPDALADGADRLAMLKLAVEGEGLFDVCDIELARAGPSYTIDTLAELRRGRPRRKITMVIGMDMLAELPKWHRAGELVERTAFLVAARPPWQDRMGAVRRALADAFGPARAEELTASVAETPLVEISSTDVRERQAAGLSIRYLVPESVRKYIDSRDLYRRRGWSGPGRGVG